MSIRFQVWEEVVRDSSVEVGFFWEGATCSSDDDVGGVVCCLHALIQWFLLDELRQETCTTEGQLEQESRENTDSQQATQKCIKGKKIGKSHLLQKHHLHRLCRQCPWGQFSVQGMSQPCHLNREGTRDSDIQK